MTPIDSLSGAARATTPSSGPANAAMIDSDFQTFLVMLTTQMQNQDPLNPIDSTDYAAQLATFSGVEQQVKTNQLLEALSTQMGSSGMAQMATWVGMEARTSAPVTFDGQPLTLYPSPAPGADRAELVATDGLGREVMRLDVPVSSAPITWVGVDSAGTPFPTGSYSIRLDSSVAGTVVSSTPVESYDRIDEVRSGPDGTVLVMQGGALLAPAEILALRQPTQ